MNESQQNKKVVVIGGGTGLSTMLKGLKKYTHAITAVVTVADNGGSSGRLREEMGVIPPGDIRNCLVALANTEPTMEKLLQYRFKDGSLCGQSFGNLFLAALTDITGNFEEAVKLTSHVLAITGKVLPVTLEDVHLQAVFSNQTVVRGECQIAEYGKSTGLFIQKIDLIPKEPTLMPEVIEALYEADLILLGPGSLYTSIIPNLLVKDMCKHLRNAKAEKIYIANIMTQPGETGRLSLEQHIEILEYYLGKYVINKVIVNNEKIEQSYLKQYIEDGANVLNVDESHKVWDNIERVEAPLIKVSQSKKLIRHDSEKLAKCIFEVATH